MICHAKNSGSSSSARSYASPALVPIVHLKRDRAQRRPSRRRIRIQTHRGLGVFIGPVDLIHADKDVGQSRCARSGFRRPTPPLAVPTPSPRQNGGPPALPTPGMRWTVLSSGANAARALGRLQRLLPVLRLVEVDVGQAQMRRQITGVGRNRIDIGRFRAGQVAGAKQRLPLGAQ